MEYLALKSIGVIYHHHAPRQLNACRLATPFPETVDKCEMPLDTAAEKMRPIRGERKRFFKIKY